MNLEWKDEYALGMPAVDLQHKRIFECIVSMAAETAAKHDRGLADASFVQLLRHLQEHTALEESMMRSFGYPGLDRHIEEHRQIQAAVQDSAQESPRTNLSVSLEVIESIHKWQREHIMTSDRHYMEYLLGPSHARRGDKPAPK